MFEAIVYIHVLLLEIFGIFPTCENLATVQKECGKYMIIVFQSSENISVVSNFFIHQMQINVIFPRKFKGD